LTSALSAAHDWRRASLSRRSAVLFAFRELLHARTDELAEIVTAEHARCSATPPRDRPRTGECRIRYRRTAVDEGRLSPEQASTGVDVYSIRQPLGVVAGITPFNFPVMVPLWMWCQRHCLRQRIHSQAEREGSVRIVVVGPALAGSRPARRRFSASSRRQASSRCHAIGSPRQSRRSAFVGSTPIRRYIYETGTAAGKRVQALGGAKNHISSVLPDADVDLAADAAVSAAYGRGRRALHGHLGRGRRGRRRRSAGRGHRQSAAQAGSIGDGSAPGTDMVRAHHR